VSNVYFRFDMAISRKRPCTQFDWHSEKAFQRSGMKNIFEGALGRID
jgi:hypothetical protein